MQPIRVVPCLDFKDGRVVKGVNFVNLRDAGDPVECAKAYNEAGADELAFLDLAASVENRGTRIDMVKNIARSISIPFTVGGGIASVEDARAVLEAGADRISVNSSAVRRPELVRELADAFGSSRVVLAIDAAPIEGTDRYDVCVLSGGQGTGIDAYEWAIKGEALGAGEILLTGLNTDGMRTGYDLKMLRGVSSRVKVPVVASGGAGKLEDFYLAVAEGGASVVLAASLFHFGVVTVRQVKEYLRDKGIPVIL